jgi:predicted HicB family RNase H-like nuclease
MASYFQKMRILEMLNYKGYVGSSEVDIESGLLHGRVLDIRDVMTFQGTTVAAARQEIEQSVDDYLDFCTELGQEPDKPFSGKLPFRTSSEHHRLIFLAASKAGKSMNAWMDEVLIHEASKLTAVAKEY